MLSTSRLTGQGYEIGVGLRTGDLHGFTARIDFDKAISMDGILGLRDRGITAAVLLQFNKPVDVFWSRGLSWYYGYGVHFGYIKTQDIRYLYWNYEPEYSYSVSAIGADGVIGLLYRFPRFPLEIALENKPYLELVNVKRFRMRLFETSLAVRYKLNYNF